MNIPSLTVLCSQKIVSNESLFSRRRELPLAAREAVEKTAIVCKWKWFATPSAGENTQFKFNLTPRNYEDFCTLCLSPQVQKPEFLLYSDQEKHTFHTVSRIIKFVRKKGHITGIEGPYLSNNNPQNSISLYYQISTSDRVYPSNFFSFSVKIAKITLPHKEHQAVEICIEPLSKINESVISKWSQKTYSKVHDFVIYYVNQLAIEKENFCFFLCPTTVNDRLYLAQNSQEENEVMKHLFED